MLRQMFQALLRGSRRSSTRPATRRPFRFAPAVQFLEQREVPAVLASFSGGVLVVVGDGADDAISVNFDAAGTLLVSGGTVPIVGGAPTAATLTQITVFGYGGNDTIALGEAHGALPKAFLFGGDGNDILIGGSGADHFFGQAGNDSIVGNGGADLLFGDDGNDILVGNTGSDQAFGNAGDDLTVWNNGDGSDLFEGGAGTDTVLVNGGTGDEAFTAAANGTRVRFDRTTAVAFSLDIGTSESLVVSMNTGNDSFAGGALAGLILLTVDGGAGNDTIAGGNGADTLQGGDGDDFIDGNQGSDTALLGAGTDTFQWDPGDGSDVIEGGAGTDTLLFNSSAAAEIFDASANGARLRFTRNVGNVVLDTDDIEVLTLNALGGADAVTLNDLAATDVRFVNIDLGVSGAGDTAIDAVTVNGSAGADVIGISGGSGAVTVQTGQVTIAVTNTEPANDSLTVNGGVGQDTISAASLGNSSVLLTLNGGVADDVLVGSNGNDTLNGDAGDDILSGGNGSDTLDGGADIDLIDGGAGTDTAANGETVVNVP